jgi:hypothetical protein
LYVDSLDNREGPAFFGVNITVAPVPEAASWLLLGALLVATSAVAKAGEFSKLSLLNQSRSRYLPKGCIPVHPEPLS